MPERKISCSIGGYEFVFPENHPHILAMADEMIYKAKESGRACYKLHTIHSANSSGQK